MPEDPVKPGTPQSDAGDPPDNTAESQSEDEGGGREDGRGEPDYKRLYLESKTKIEEANQLRAEVERLRSERTAAPLPAERAVDDERAALDQEEADIAALRAVADQSPYARQQLREREARLRHERLMFDAFTLQSVPETDRPKLMQFYNQNRGRYSDLAQAKGDYDRLQQGETIKQLNARIAELEKGGNGAGKRDSQADTDVVRTAGGRDISTPTHKARSMTIEDFRTKKQALLDEGRTREAHELESQLRRKEIVFVRR